MASATHIEAEIFALKNANGMSAAISNFGAIVQSLTVPDRDGNFGDVVLGFDTLAGYFGRHPYFGAIVGRYGNRIAGGRFVLDGCAYALAKNNGPNSLHGGLKGFDKALWTARPVETGASVTLSYVSADGEEGYPGELSTTVVYSLTDDDELRIDYRLETTRATPVNLTNHTYFNLAGAGKGDVLDQVAEIVADRYLPVDETQIPLGELRAVEGTPFDFRRPTAIGARIDADDPQVEIGGGYDHNWVLARNGDGCILAARVFDPGSGRAMDVRTTEPGLQFYAGNKLDGSIVGKGGAAYGRHSGFCMETQHFPDSPNHEAFPSTTLRPGEVRESTTVYRFYTV